MGTLLETINITTKQNTAFSTTIVPPAGYKLGHIHIVDSAGAESEIDVPTAQALSYLLSLPLPPQKIDVCVVIAERLICMPTQMIQYELENGIVHRWGCYRKDVSGLDNYTWKTCSARKLIAGSAMKWTSGAIGAIDFSVQKLDTLQANGASAGVPIATPLSITFSMQHNQAAGSYYYERPASNAWQGFTDISTNPAVVGNFEWVALEDGRMQLKKDNVIIKTSVMALDIVNTEYVFALYQSPQPLPITNFRFENMGSTASWTVV